LALPDPVRAPDGPPKAPRLWLLALAIGVIAGLISWGVEEVALLVFAPTYELDKKHRASTQVAGAEMVRQRLVATVRTATTSSAALGGLLGLGLGLVGGRVRGSWQNGLRAGVVGLLLGAGGGAVLTWKLVPRYYDEMAKADELTLPLLVHLGMWGSAGIAGGLALGIGIGSWNRGVTATIGGLVGAALGIAICEFAGAIAFPMAETNLPISASLGSRLIVHLGVAVFAALGAGAAAEFIGETPGHRAQRS
jgi:MFS family permease